MNTPGSLGPRSLFVRWVLSQGGRVLTVLLMLGVAMLLVLVATGSPEITLRYTTACLVTFASSLMGHYLGYCEGYADR